MIENGLKKVWPRRKDYSLLHTLGAVDTKGLPDNFSIYDGRSIPDQRKPDTRFKPPVRPLLFGCTGESQTFAAGLADTMVYPPDDLYDHTPPGRDGEGRDLRASLQATIDWGFRLPNGNVGNKRTAFFNCYGAGKIDDTDAARIALWINQAEKRAVTVGSWWYSEFEGTSSGTLPTPSFNTALGSLHNYIITGWRTNNGVVELEVIPWLGMYWGENGVGYMPRVIYNALMQQPWTGAFTETALTSKTPVPIGIQAYLDHLVYFIRNLFSI